MNVPVAPTGRKCHLILQNDLLEIIPFIEFFLIYKLAFKIDYKMIVSIKMTLFLLAEGYASFYVFYSIEI